MGKVKRNADAGHAVGREPFFSEPDVRLKANLARVQFFVEPLDAVLQNGSPYAQRKVAQALVQQLLVRHQMPFC